MNGPRAVAVVVRDGRLLVIKRHVFGKDYAVLPGGSVEDGETFEQAAVRELAEESTMRAEIGRQILAGRHNGREARYFLMANVEGDPELSGPEREDHSPDNSFTFVWADAHALPGLGLFPAHLQKDLPDLLDLSAAR